MLGGRPYWGAGKGKNMQKKIFFLLVCFPLLFSSCMTMPEKTFEKKERNIDFYLYENGDPINLYDVIETETIERGYKFNRVLDGAKITDYENSYKEATGSGFLVSNKGYIITNAHVVNNYNNISIVKNNYEYKAQIISIDQVNDIALLEVPELSGENYLSFTSLNEKKLGEKIYCIGFPLNSVLGNEARITDGIISAKSGLANSNSIFQISAPIQPGNSGGPVIDEKGNVIGIVVSKLNDLYGLEYSGSIPQNVNFAIKSDIAITLFQKFIQNNSAVKNITEAIDCCVLVKNNNDGIISQNKKYILKVLYTYSFDLVHYTLSSMQIYVVDSEDGKIIDSIKWTGETFNSANTIAKVLINRLLDKFE